ncbi:MAG: thiamine-monophosphate kinase [Candidatus Aureabacteria bacterium]|nr:thiamine-monophosphate kinase [Candidatus Auribacterota bacterium]
MNELKILSFLKKTYNPLHLPYLIGDDAALLPVPEKGKQLVISLDTLVEKTHFKKTTPAFQTGQKLASVSLSDMAAMGAVPLHLLVSIAVPKSKTGFWLRELYRGINDRIRPYRVLLTGGDSVGSPLTVLTSVMIGECSSPLYRKGAASGDFLYATGFFGYSLPSGHHLHFIPRIHEIQWLRKQTQITSLTDASDGLARSIEILTTDWGKGARIELDSLPIRRHKHPTLTTLAHALFDGEDFELVFTGPAIPSRTITKFQKKFKIPLSCLGKVTSVQKVDYFFRSKKIHSKGKPFEHF